MKAIIPAAVPVIIVGLVGFVSILGSLGLGAEPPAADLPGGKTAPRPDEPLAPWGANHHATDAPKRHVEQIAAGRHAYAVRQGGTMDGANCRSPVGVGMMDGPAIRQTWESNRAVRLENIGDTDVINPWLSNGRNSFRNLGEIVSSAV